MLSGTLGRKINFLLHIFSGFVKDMFTCDPAVKAYLCKHFGVQNIPVFGSQAEDNLENLVHEFSVFFTGNTRYSVVKSSYSNNVSTSSNSIKDRNWLSFSVDSEKFNRLNTKLQNANLAHQNMEQSVKEAGDNLKRSDQSMETKRKEIKAVQDQMQKKRILKGKVAAKQSQIDTFKNEHKGKDLIKEKQKVELKKESLIKKDLNLAKDIVDVMKQLSKIRQSIELAKAAASVYQSSESRLIKALNEEREGVDKLKAQFGEQEENLRVAKEEHLKQLRNAQILTSNQIGDFRGTYIFFLYSFT